MKPVLGHLLRATLFCTIALLGGCSDDEDTILGTHQDDAEELHSWIWVLDDETGTLWVHDADTGTVQATHEARGHPFMRQAFAGPDAEPTVWMGRDGAAYGFTRGFHPHGDHVHMEIPEALVVMSTGPGNTHQGVDAHAEFLVYANDGDSTFTVIDVASRTARTVGHGSGHSAAFYSHGRLVATDMHAKWARGVDVDSDAIAFEVSIDTLAHGDAFHHDSETLFIATLGGFEVLDLESEALAAPIPYPGAGRVNFLYHAGDVPVAFGPHKIAGHSDAVILLHMEERAAEALAVEESALAWNIGGGNFALSEDGRMLVATDLVSARAYLMCIDPENGTCFKSVRPITVPAADMACAINYAGDHIWVFDKNSGRIYCYHADDGELHNSWQADATGDYIFVTSYAPGFDILKDY
jgi:hypothetical protein